MLFALSTIGLPLQVVLQVVVLLLIKVVASMGQVLPFDMRVESTPVKFLRFLNLLLVKNFYVTFLLVVELSFKEVHLPAWD